MQKTTKILLGLLFSLSMYTVGVNGQEQGSKQTPGQPKQQNQPKTKEEIIKKWDVDGDGALNAAERKTMMDHWRIAGIAGLISMGWVNKLIMSHDSIMPGGWLGRNADAVIPPGLGPRHIFMNLIPALKKARVTDQEINTILVENPRRLFTGE